MKWLFLLSSLIFPLVVHAAPGSYSGNFEEDYDYGSRISTLEALSHPRVVAVISLTAIQCYLIHKSRNEYGWIPYYLSLFVSFLIVWAFEKLIL